MRQRTAAGARFNDDSTRFQLQIRRDHRDIGKVDNLRSMRQQKSPKFGSGMEQVDPAFSCAREHLRKRRLELTMVLTHASNLRSEFQAQHILMLEVTVLIRIDGIGLYFQQNHIFGTLSRLNH